MKKLILYAHFLFFLIGSVAAAQSGSTMFCNRKANVKVAIEIQEKSLKMDTWGVKDGQPFHDTGLFQILESKDIRKEDFKENELKLIYAVADIQDFSEGKQYKIQQDSQKPVDLMTLRFKSKAYAGILFVEGWPLSIGKTNTCW